MSVRTRITRLDAAAFTAAFETEARRIVIDELAGEALSIANDMANRMRQIILDAHTMTGRDRVASGRGPYAGRYETGEFYNAVDYDIDVNPDGVIIAWGWLQEWEDYFAYQEFGTEHIAAVGALADTFTLSLARTALMLNRVTE